MFLLLLFFFFSCCSRYTFLLFWFWFLVLFFLILLLLVVVVVVVVVLLLLRPAAAATTTLRAQKRLRSGATDSNKRSGAVQVALPMTAAERELAAKAARLTGLKHPPLPLADVSIGMESVCQQNDRTLAGGCSGTSLVPSFEQLLMQLPNPQTELRLMP